MKLSLKLDIGLVALVPMLLATQAHAACLDITALTPIEALMKLDEWQRRAKQG